MIIKTKGFTLIEVMVVVVILGILAAIIVPKIMSRPEQARMVKVKQDILAIQSALDLYKLDNGMYPSTDQGLEALVKKTDEFSRTTKLEIGWLLTTNSYGCLGTTLSIPQ